MAYLESGIFCSATEFERGLPKRVTNADVRQGDLYSFVLRLNSRKREASKLAVRTLEVEHKVGISVVTFAFIDEKLEPICEVKDVMADGIFNRVKDSCVIDNKTQETYPILQGYFKDYFEDQFGDVLFESDQLSLVRY